MGNSTSSTSNSSDNLANRASNQPTGGGEENENPEQMSYWQMAKQGYQELVNAIIRPPRCIYEMKHLGPNMFDFCGKSFIRQDFDLFNGSGLKLVCSMWEPIESCRQNPVLPCVVYLHGNSSARLEGLAQLSVVLALGVTFFSLDFSGSGMSDGDYVSLGAFEKDDLMVVVEYLRSSGRTSTIALWGRSMGATTALLHGERDPSIAGMVLDSAFSDLSVLAEEMVEKGRQQGLFAPSLVVKMAIRFIRSSVQKTANFDIKDLAPIEHADKCFIPALFIAAEDDTFVAPHHSKRIHEKYAGDKNLIIVEGDHNSARPRFLFDSVSIFLTHTLQIPEDWILPDSSKYITSFPWMTGKSRGRYVNLGMENIGMTQSRQDELQAKLKSAFTGGTSSSGGVNAANNSNKNKNINNNNNISNTTPNNNNNISNDNGINSPRNDYVFNINNNNKSSSQAPSRSSSGINTGTNNNDKSATTASNNNNTLDSPPYNNNNDNNNNDEDDDQHSEWICSTCTLINIPDDDICSACGIPRYDEFFTY